MDDVSAALPREPDASDIRSLMKHAASERFHPVIVFGGFGSGKTAMIMSLLRFLLLKPNGVHALIDPDFFPPDYPDRMNRIRNARDYVQKLLKDFVEGQIRQTEVDRPVFLPFTITAGKPIDSAEDHIRIVIADGRGEWFQVSTSGQGSDGSWTEDFKPELLGVIKSPDFQALTTIFVSPHSTGLQGVVPSSDVTSGLASIINKYRREREDESRDYNLFLFTKWDRHATARRRDAIWSPDMEKLDKDLRERAREAWATYYNSETPPLRQRYFMQYVSMFGSSDGHDVTLPPPGTEDDTILDHYSRVLLNWIYANASEATWGTRTSLFPEVDAYRDESMPIYDRILGWIAGARP